jgi:macrolide transport system ATP-binding/permease protein
VNLTSASLAPAAEPGEPTSRRRGYLMSSLLPLVARDVSMSYGDKTVLDGVDLTATPGRPVGIVGENGVGKSTLLRLLAAAEAPSSGVISRPDDLGYLPQEPAFDHDATVATILADALAPLHDAIARLERLAGRLDDPSAADEYADTLAWAEHHDAWDADRRADIAKARLDLGSIDPAAPASRLSGGERSRVAMAALVTRQPDCVVLDEPTNHLDDQAMDFVEEFMSGIPGVVVLASHDRVLLDRVCAEVVDLDPSYAGLDGEGGRRFAGGFTGFLAAKQAARARWERAFAEHQDELDRLRSRAKTTARNVAHNRGPRDNDKFLYNFKGGNVQSAISRRVRDAEQRIEVLERDRVPKPPPPLHFDTPLAAAGRGQGGTVWVRGLEVPGRLRLSRLDLGAGEALLVTGRNGSGKSTLLQVLAGEVEPSIGDVQVSARRVELMPQDVRYSHPDRTPHQVFRELAGDAVALGSLGLLHPRELGRPVGALSVGQQRRLALAVVVAREPDLLLLDEPTNHISLALASELEDALQRSTGTVVVASHDRWLRQHWDRQLLALQ